MSASVGRTRIFWKAGSWMHLWRLPLWNSRDIWIDLQKQQICRGSEDNDWLFCRCSYSLLWRLSYKLGLEVIQSHSIISFGKRLSPIILNWSVLEQTVDDSSHLYIDCFSYLKYIFMTKQGLLCTFACVHAHTNKNWGVSREKNLLLNVKAQHWCHNIYLHLLEIETN